MKKQPLLFSVFILGSLLSSCSQNSGPVNNAQTNLAQLDLTSGNHTITMTNGQILNYFVDEMGISSSATDDIKYTPQVFKNNINQYNDYIKQQAIGAQNFSINNTKCNFWFIICWSNHDYRWHNSVAYQIDPELDAKWGKSIRDYINTIWNPRVPFLPLVEDESAKDRIYITMTPTLGGNSSSQLGRQGGIQNLYLNRDITEKSYEPYYSTKSTPFKLGTREYVGEPTATMYINYWRGTDRAEMAILAHELAHSYGLQHEHQRCDRDNYITGVEIATQPKLCNNGITLTPFDYSALTLYPNAIEKEGHPDTFIGDPKNPGQRLSIQQGILDPNIPYSSPSDGDVTALLKMTEGQ